MKRWMLLGLLLAAVPVCAQDMPNAQKPPKAPELTFHVVPDFFKIPSDMIMAEAVGVAINSKGHIFILNRGNHPMLEFDSGRRLHRFLWRGFARIPQCRTASGSMRKTICGSWARATISL